MAISGVSTKCASSCVAIKSVQSQCQSLFGAQTFVASLDRFWKKPRDLFSRAQSTAEHEARRYSMYSVHSTPAFAGAEQPTWGFRARDEERKQRRKRIRSARVCALENLTQGKGNRETLHASNIDL